MKYKRNRKTHVAEPRSVSSSMAKTIDLYSGNKTYGPNYSALEKLMEFFSFRKK